MDDGAVERADPVTGGRGTSESHGGGVGLGNSAMNGASAASGGPPGAGEATDLSVITIVGSGVAVTCGGKGVLVVVTTF
jgi:hypothetical protein